MRGVSATLYRIVKIVQFVTCAPYRRFNELSWSALCVGMNWNEIAAYAEDPVNCPEHGGFHGK